MSNKVKVGILGATSYTGLELVLLLKKHPDAEISFLSSKSYSGQKFSEIFGQAYGICDDILLSPDEATKSNIQIDCVFSCLPHAISAKMLMPWIENSVKVIDLSADFRIKDKTIYEKWYKTEHPAPKLLDNAVFGLPEHYRNEISKTSILANPGCYPTSILLPTLPLLKESDVSIASIISDSKSGVSGAGRSLKQVSHYVEANENMSAYAIGRAHRHIAEIDQELSSASGKNMSIIFSPHLTPIERGILSTIYLQINKTAEECESIVKNAYKDEPFVRVRNSGDLPQIHYVAKTNYCDIAFTGGENGTPVIAVSVIDNLIKGASGQALQNMNIMFGLKETLGLI